MSEDFSGNEMIQKIMQNKIVMAVVNIMLGIYLMIARNRAVITLIQIVGYVMIGIGVIYLALFLFGRQRRDNVQLGFAIGCAVLGLIVVLLAPAIELFFPIIIGIILILTALGNLTTTRGGDYPLFSKIGPIVTMVLGVVIVVFPRESIDMVVLLTGIALAVNGISELLLIYQGRD